MTDPTPAEALKAERIEHLRKEIYRCECVIEKGAPDSWWREDLSRLKQELDVLTRPPTLSATPDAGEVRTYREGVEAAAREVDSWLKRGPKEPNCDAVWEYTCTLLAAAIRKLP